VTSALAETIADNHVADLAEGVQIIVSPPLALMEKLARKAAQTEMRGRNRRSGYSPCVDQDDLQQEAMLAMWKQWRTFVGQPDLEKRLAQAARCAARKASRREGCAGRISRRQAAKVNPMERHLERGRPVDYTKAGLTTEPTEMIERVLDEDLAARNAGLSEQEKLAYLRRTLGDTFQEVADDLGMGDRKAAFRICQRATKKVEACRGSAVRAIPRDSAKS
jgi:DNA-directed RNA polymerase specialized sigma24 family protein